MKKRRPLPKAVDRFNPATDGDSRPFVLPGVFADILQRCGCDEDQLDSGVNDLMEIVSDAVSRSSAKAQLAEQDRDIWYAKYTQTVQGVIKALKPLNAAIGIGGEE